MNDDYNEPFDIALTTKQLRESWECVPDLSLGELIDTVFGGSLYDLQGGEAREMLNEFILQNQ